MENQEFEKEQNRLKEIIEQYKEVYADLTLVLKSTKSKNAVDPIALNNLISNYENKLKILEQGFLKPYFARIDFTANDSQVKEECYIGKVGVSDYDGNLITIDWRAPIASLYYDSNLGPVAYEAPEGIISGQMDLKRQYDIENGKLKSYRDVDTVSNDEILKPYLGVNADSRLKNIVSSIQDEQNKIIRMPINQNLICQGVAGSGKTTVALHRIAYLVYNFRDKIDSSQYMVIGPNKFFINYISSVLPELDVTSVPQLTYNEFVEKFLNEKLNIKDIGYNRDLVFKINPYSFKLSMDYKKMLDDYVKYLDNYQVIPNKDFAIQGISIITKEAILETYQEVDEKYFKSIHSKIDRVILRLSNYIKDNSSKLLSLVEKELSILLETKKITKDKYQKDYTFIKKEIESGCVISLRKYFSFKNKKTSLLYKEFLKKLSQFSNREIVDSLNKITFPTNIFTFEDMPALIYLHCLIHGVGDYKKYQHAVIDEAQDYGVFNFYALKQAMPNCKFSVFGDLAQSIYDYRSIDSWNEVIHSCFDDNCSIEYLLKSYRTTIEIMEEANQILDYLNLKTSVPVIRHGKKVKYTLFEKMDVNILKNKIMDLVQKKYQSIALISRTDEEAKIISEILKDINVIYFDIENNCYQGCSKGLEFDAVILLNVSEKNYSSNNNTDMKNLYVAMTRALHSLEILYQEPLTKPLQRSLFKDCEETK